MATIPIYDPVIPFLGLIPGSVRPGLILKIRGQIHGFENRCQINIQKGPALQPRDDVVLHISIRPQQASIVRNHLQNQIWGREESYGGSPISVNQQFEMIILTEAMHFKIAVNGRHFCVFKHRLPLYEGKYISVNGGCTIQSITIENEISQIPSTSVPSYPTHHHHHHHHNQNQMGFVPPPYPVPVPNYPIGNPPPPPPYPGLGNSIYPGTPYQPMPYSPSSSGSMNFKQELMDKIRKMH